jgi:diamine N-acetyltransferase
MFNIRTAGAADSAAISAVHAAASGADAHQAAGHSHDLTYVAETDGRVVGFIALQLASHPAVESRNPIQLWQIYVLPEFHGSGAANQLMAAAFGRARMHLHDVIWLGVSEHNGRGIAFYRKHGFGSLGLHQVGVGGHMHQDIVMSCALG